MKVGFASLLVVALFVHESAYAQIADQYRQAAQAYRASAAASSNPSNKQCYLANANYYDCLATMSGTCSGPPSCSMDGAESSSTQAPIFSTPTSPLPSNAADQMANALGGLVSVFQSARNEQRRREEAQRQADEEAQYRAEVERERQEERERQLAEERQEDAEQALDESCRLLIEAAAQTGGQVDLAGDNACSRPINAWLERNTRYSGGGRRSPTRPIDEPVIDGSQVPSLIDFTPSHALEELVESTAADSSTVPPNEDALDELLSSFFPADENPSSSTQAPEDPGSPVQIAEPAPEFETSTDSGEQSNGDGGDGASADDTPAGNPSALSILVGSATSTETIYDKVGEALASELYEDPVQRRLAELFAGAVGSTPNFKPVVDHAADLGAGMLLDKLDDLRHRAMTDPHAFDGIANGEQIRDLLWSMDPSNLRKGIYSYPSDMIDKLNTLFDSVGRGDGEEKQ